MKSIFPSPSIFQLLTGNFCGFFTTTTVVSSIFSLTSSIIRCSFAACWLSPAIFTATHLLPISGAQVLLRFSFPLQIYVNFGLSSSEKVFIHAVYSHTPRCIEICFAASGFKGVQTILLFWGVLFPSLYDPYHLFLPFFPSIESTSTLFLSSARSFNWAGLRHPPLRTWFNSLSWSWTPLPHEYFGRQKINPSSACWASCLFFTDTQGWASCFDVPILFESRNFVVP